MNELLTELVEQAAKSRRGQLVLADYLDENPGPRREAELALMKRLIPLPATDRGARIGELIPELRVYVRDGFASFRLTGAGHIVDPECRVAALGLAVCWKGGGGACRIDTPLHSDWCRRHDLKIVVTLYL